ncbi:MAG TPA: ribosome small subunit-dependent GTPase A [Pyrinomonadaceae bacterium]
MQLEKYGWNDFFVEGFAPYAAEGYGVGRILLQHNKIYVLYTEDGEMEAEVTGRLRHEAAGPHELPAVGDWVATRERGTDGTLMIHAVLPRSSKFSRKVSGSRTDEQVVAANVDTVFLVAGLDGDYNPRRIERYLIMAWESGARPIVVLNKSDLDPAGAAERAVEVEAVAPGVAIVLLSAKHDEQLAQLAPFVGPGRTVALMGSSGVGKSTIVNRLAGSDVQRTAEVRVGDSRGRHTTTHRQLILLPGGGLVIDTPGMRELQLLVSERGMRETFEEIETLAAQCRFTDCRHAEERDCVVRAALADGTLDAERYANYQKMLGEMRHTAVRQDQRAAQEEKSRVKRLTRAFNKTDKRR